MNILTVLILSGVFLCIAYVLVDHIIPIMYEQMMEEEE